MKLPAKLRVLGHNILVERVKVGFTTTTVQGEYDSEQGIISVRMGMEPSIEEATVLHEVIHVIDVALDLGLSEDQVVGVAQGLFQFLADNEFMQRKKS
jgi:hypothetical protein